MQVTNSRQRVSRRHAHGDDIEFYFFCESLIFSSLCGCSRVQIHLLRRGGCYPRTTSCMTTTETPWTCIRARGQASGCTMDPILVVRSRSSPAWRCLRRQRPISELRPVELPRLARPKWCFAAYYVRSIDELSGCTTGSLGYSLNP